MSGSGKPASFFVGFGQAAMGLGALLVLAWVGLWAVEAFGGPDWTMPRSLLTSAGAMIALGWIVTYLATQNRAAPIRHLDDQET